MCIEGVFHDLELPGRESDYSAQYIVKLWMEGCMPSLPHMPSCYAQEQIYLGLYLNEVYILCHVHILWWVDLHKIYKVWFKLRVESVLEWARKSIHAFKRTTFAVNWWYYINRTSFSSFTDKTCWLADVNVCTRCKGIPVHKISSIVRIKWTLKLRIWFMFYPFYVENLQFIIKRIYPLNLWIQTSHSV